MIAEVEINVLDELPKLTMKNGIIKAETYPYRQDENNIGKLLLTGMRKNPKLVNQVDAETGKEDTFGEIADRTVKCALWLLSQGVKPGDVVAICTHNHIDAVIPVVACLCIGAIFNPWWDHGLNRDTAKHFMALTTPKVLFTDEKYTELVSDVARDLKIRFQIVVFGRSTKFESFDDIIRKYKPSDVESFQCTKLSSMSEPAYIEYTSGSTGLPKGALHSHKSLFGNVMNAGTFGGCNNVVLCYSNLCWITGVLCTLSSIAHFQKRIIAKAFTPENLCELVEKYKITWILTGTSAANRLLKSGVLSKYDLSSIKSVWIGGAVFKQDAQDALQTALPGAYIIQLYGTTESGGVSIHQTKMAKPNSVGTLARWFEMKVIDPESGRILGVNEKGELCVKSPFMMTGYYKNPEKTKEIIKADGWLHTGDQAYYDNDGAVYIIDRLKELIKWRGHHVSPSVIEQIIMTYPGVTEAGVVGVPDWEDDERPIAFIAKSPEVKITENDIKKFVEDNLPEQMWLRAGVRILDQMPHTASGKIARTALKEMAKEFIRDSLITSREGSKFYDISRVPLFLYTKTEFGLALRSPYRPIIFDLVRNCTKYLKNTPNSSDRYINTRSKALLMKAWVLITAQSTFFFLLMIQIDATTMEEDTYNAMLDRSVRCAIWLKKQGVQPGDVIGYCSKNNLDSFAPVCASLYIAAIFNPWWDNCLDGDIIRYFIELAKPKVIFADEVSAKMILNSINYTGTGPKIVVFGEYHGLDSFRDVITTINSEDIANFQCTKLKSPHDPAVIMYTSGTTGKPKGALYSNGSFTNMVGVFPHYEGKKVGLWFATLCWISGTGALIRSLILKSTSIIHNCGSEEEACRITEKFGVTWLTMGTAFANRLYKTDAVWGYDLSSIHRVTVGGGVLKSEVAVFLRKLFSTASILSVYGTTEIGAATAGLITDEKTTITGKVTQNYEIKVVDLDTQEILGPHQEGELYVRGAARMLCYWNNPEATAEAIDSEGWYHTGDVGHYDEDGDFYITERIKELIKYRLYHVPPAAIESVIQEHPEIAEVGVVGKPDNNDLEQPLAFVTRRPGAKVTENEITELVANKLHDWMKLRGGVCFLEEMPHTASGKIAKRQLRAFARAMT
ncbi:uncharacterized protein LOC107046639 [Diachasma alloeum]|uniref:uncharacterized protein LOC107046639 n=1 Tax=Diachasma alloeum TaxID=454923 RepID=UPI000738124E|nr:uncharacterized protein LOC107046639 [Diachasma alloeum]